MLHIYNVFYTNLKVAAVFGTEEKFTAGQRSCMEVTERPSLGYFTEEASSEQAGARGESVCRCVLSSQLALLCELGECTRAPWTLFRVHARVAVTRGAN